MLSSLLTQHDVVWSLISIIITLWLLWLVLPVSILVLSQLLEFVCFCCPLLLLSSRSEPLEVEDPVAELDLPVPGDRRGRVVEQPMAGSGNLVELLPPSGL